MPALRLNYEEIYLFAFADFMFFGFDFRSKKRRRPQDESAVEPFKIIGNIYYVGASDVTSYLITTPQGAPTADEINPTKSGTKPSEFEADRKQLLDCIENLCALPEIHLWANHAAFGKLSYKQWGKLHHKHIDHHLKQSGV